MSTLLTNTRCLFDKSYSKSKRDIRKSEYPEGNYSLPTKKSDPSKQIKVLPGLFQKPAPQERACAPRAPQSAKPLPALSFGTFLSRLRCRKKSGVGVCTLWRIPLSNPNYLIISFISGYEVIPSGLRLYSYDQVSPPTRQPFGPG